MTGYYRSAAVSEPRCCSLYLIRIGTGPSQSNGLAGLDILGPAGEGQGVGSEAQGEESGRNGEDTVEMHDAKKE